MKRILTSLAFLLTSPVTALAANKLTTVASEPENILEFIRTISNWVFAFLLTIAVIYILLAAWEYLTSKGGEGVDKAHKMIFYSAIAIVVAVLAKGIVYVAAALAGRNNISL